MLNKFFNKTIKTEKYKLENIGKNITDKKIRKAMNQSTIKIVQSFL